MKKQYIVTFWPIKIADKYSFIFKSLVFCKALNHKQKIINPIGITDNDLKKCELVHDKFEEKYGGDWGVSFIKNGEALNIYYNYTIKQLFKRKER